MKLGTAIVVLGLGLSGSNALADPRSWRNEPAEGMVRLIKELYGDTLTSAAEIALTQRGKVTQPWPISGGVFEADVKDVAGTTPYTIQIRMWFSPSWHMARLMTRIEGKPTPIARFRQLLSDHEEWSNAEALKAIEQAGAKYPPPNFDGLKPHLKINKLEPFLGKVAITDARFDLRYTLTPDGPHRYQPAVAWMVFLEATVSGRDPWRYVMTIEPFEGTLEEVAFLDRRQ